MSISNKKHKRRSAESPLLNTGNDVCDLVIDHLFLAPFEICENRSGFLSILMDRHIIDMSFAKLYQQSTKSGWEKTFNQERQKLKPNDISVLKCFVLNRLLYEYHKNPTVFVEQTTKLYYEIRSRMTREFPQWTPHNLLDEVRHWQEIQCRRRLFYFNAQELSPQSSLLMLQKASTNWCFYLMNHCKQNKTFWESEGQHRFVEHFQHSFIIVAQPTGPENVAVIQYTKTSSGHSARLNTRIICLLDPDIFKDDIQLSDIDVTLFPLNREINNKKEKQPSIKWQIRKILSGEGTPVSVLYAEIHSLQLETFDSVCKRLSLNSTLCQLEFRWKVKTKNPEFEDTIVMTTQPFGICSHAQYFPKFTAQIFLYEMKQILKIENQITDPQIITEFFRRYYRRTVGIEPNDHTNRYIRQVFLKAIEDVKSTRTASSLDSLYEEILAKMISQIDFMVLHPVLTLMYDDGLFLGICDSMEVDKMLNGTREHPQLLLRFNTLTNHQWNTNPTVQLIIHDGDLKRASFDMKTFANEMCRFICESLGEKTKQASVLSIMSTRNFSDFHWYFHDELYRLNKMSLPSTDSYDPLLPVLWMTMRHNYQNDISDTFDSSRKRKHSDSLSCISPDNIVVHLDDVSKDVPRLNHATKSKNQQISIILPHGIDLSPGVIFRHLAERFSDESEDVSSNYLIQPKQITFSLADAFENDQLSHMTSPLDLSFNNADSSSEMNRVESSILTDHIPNQMIIKQEPQDVNYVMVQESVIKCE